MDRRLGGLLLFWVCLLCLSPLRAMAQSGAIPTVGIYNCYTDLPAEDIQLVAIVVRKTARFICN